MEVEDFDFSLSPNNIKSIPFQMYAKDFTFIVNGKSYQTNRIIADILSPILQQQHFIDRSLNVFSINTKSNNKSESNTNDYFEDFLKLGTFQNVKIDTNRRILYSEYFYILGNIAEYIRIQPSYLEGLTEENAIERLLSILNMASKFHTNFIESTIKAIVKFISIHFESMNKEKMKKLNIDIIEQIISNKSLKLQEEDSLLQFITMLYEDDHSFSPLFEYVIFNNVSMNSLENFIDLFDLNDINSSIWNSICKRLVSLKNESISIHNRYLQKELFELKDFKHQKGKEFNGICNYLTKKSGGNIHDNGTIEITSNSIRGMEEHPKNLVNYRNENRYHSDNKGDAIICFDFKDKLIQLNAYTIKSNHNDKPNSFNLRNWAIEVSEDGKNWIEVDNHKNDSSLDGPNIICTFNIENKSDKFYRFVRLRQTGDSWSPGNNPNYFWFYFIEFYGKLKEPLQQLKYAV